MRAETISVRLAMFPLLVRAKKAMKSLPDVVRPS